MPRAKRSVSKGQEKDENWLVRSPGGPLKLIKSNRTLTEDEAKEIYLSQLKVIRSRSLDDPDAKWPYLLLTTVDQVRKNHSWLLLESRRKNQRGVINVIDGEVVDDSKPLPEIIKTTTRVETRTG